MPSAPGVAKPQQSGVGTPSCRRKRLPPPGCWVQRLAVPAPFTALEARRLALLTLVAFVLRVGARWYRGAEDFWVNGYTFYFELAHSLATGHGYAFDGGPPTALRVPLYPLFLALLTQGERAFAALLLAQSLVGAATVLCGALIASELFGAGAALVTAGLLTVYPYYVVHDTALQETSLFTLLTALSVWLLLRARRQASPGYAGVAGLGLAAAVLTRSTLVPFACLAPLWLGLAMRAQLRMRLLCATLCTAALLLGLAPWLAYTRSVVGEPTLGTESGQLFWRGHNAHTFSRYPEASMDESASLAFAAISASDLATLEQTGDDALARDRWFLRRGLAYVREHPGEALSGGLRKLGAAFGVLPSPRHGPLANLVHALSYGVLLVLGVAGGWLSARRAERPDPARWYELPEHSLLYALLLCFAAVTALFFGHTSHRAFLDVYLAVYASHAIHWRPGRTPPETAAPSG